MKAWGRIAAYSRFLLGYTILVILWGAFVRATGSGAGCGSHWPLCNGEVIPHSDQLETLIEFTHRLTSGVLGIFVVILVIWTHRVSSRGASLRKAAWAVVVFVTTEALVGAGIVRFEWVANNVSMARLVTMVVHLINTFFLLNALALLWWIAAKSWNRPLVWPHGWSLLALAGVLLVGMSGAAVALGDTLILGAGLRPEDWPLLGRIASFRWTHPTLAIGAFITTLVALRRLRQESLPSLPSDGWRWGRVAALVFALQLALGAVNVWLKAPVGIQLVHLLFSNVIWVFLYLSSLSFSAARDRAPIGDVVTTEHRLA